MPPMREHIHTANLLHRIACFLEKRQVAGQGGGFAGDVDEGVGFEVDDFKDGFGVDAVSWGIEDDDVGVVGQLGDFFHDVASDERAVVQAVGFGVDLGGFDGFLDELDADDFFCYRGQDLGDGAGAAVQVEDGFILAVADVIADNGVQLFCAHGIGLEEGKGGDFKFQAEDFVVDAILTVENVQIVFFYHVGHAVVDGVENAPDLAVQFQCQEQLDKICGIEPGLGGGDQIDENFSGLLAFPDDQMAQEALVTALVEIGRVLFLKVAENGFLDNVEILIGQAAAVGFDNIVKAAALVHAQQQRAVFHVVAEGILHFIPVLKNLGAGDNSPKLEAVDAGFI